MSGGQREKLKLTNPLIVLDYIKSSIEILVNIKLQEKIAENPQISTEDSENINEYEKLLKIAESDNRNHIKVSK